MTASPLLEQTLDLQPWPTAIADAEGHLTFANTAFNRWLDCEGEEDLDRALRKQPELLDGVRAAMAGKSPPVIRVRNDKDQLTYEICLKPLAAGEGKGAVAIFADKVESDADKKQVERLALLDRALDDIARIPYSSPNATQTLDRMIKTVVRAGVADSAVIYVNHDNRWFIRHAFGIMEDSIGREVGEHAVRPSLKALREDEVVIINDLSKADKDTQNWLNRHGICAMMDIKIDSPWGDLIDLGIHYHQHPKRKFSDDDRIFLERVASGIAVALKNLGLVEQWKRDHRQLDLIMENMPSAVFVVDTAFKLVRVNKSFGVLFGVDTGKAQRRTLKEVLPPPLGDSMQQQLRQALDKEGPVLCENALSLPGGDYRAFFTSHAALKGDDGQAYGAVALVSDITERKRMEDEARHVARHDPLTGLANRRLLDELLELELANAQRNENYLALLYVDLDRFKDINDHLGHLAGDEVLRQVAVRMNNSVRAADVVARIGGDEFNVVLANLSAPERVDEAAPALLSVFDEPLTIGSHIVHVQTSIGISVFPSDAHSADELRAHADAAMYAAKRSGRNRYVVFGTEGGGAED